MIVCTAPSKTFEELEEIMHKEAELFLDEGYIFGEEGSRFERWNLAFPTKVMIEGLERLIMSNHSDKEKGDGKKYFEEYESKHNARAQEYLNNPEKLQVLYEKANKKARKRKAPLEKVWDKPMLLFELICRYYSDSRVN